MTKKAEKVILGNIYTVDKNQPKAEAAAIADGNPEKIADAKVLRTMVGGEWVYLL